jgi:hypothetical protein
MVALKEWRTPEHLVPYIDWPMLNTRFSHTAPLSIKKTITSPVEKVHGKKSVTMTPVFFISNGHILIALFF